MNLGNWLKKRRAALQTSWYGRFGKISVPDQWVFVVGCYNSGTTLLHNVLASHPDIASLPKEGQYCTDQLQVPADIGLARSWALKPEIFCLGTRSDNPPDAERIKRQWSSMMMPRECKTYIEKSIPNAARIPWLENNFENARFVGIVRNGYAVTEGIMRKGGRTVEQAAEQWAESNRIMLRDLDSASSSYLLTYEEFTQNPEELLTKVFEFLGLPSIKISPGQKLWQIHGLKSEIRNMNGKSLERLNDEEKAVVKRMGQPLLSRFGYLDNQP